MTPYFEATIPGSYAASTAHEVPASRDHEAAIGLRGSKRSIGPPVNWSNSKARFIASMAVSMSIVVGLASDASSLQIGFARNPIECTPSDAPSSSIVAAHSMEFLNDLPDKERLVARLESSIAHPAFTFRRSEADPGLLSWIGSGRRLHVSIADPIEESTYWTIRREAGGVACSAEKRLGARPERALRRSLDELARHVVSHNKRPTADRSATT